MPTVQQAMQAVRALTPDMVRRLRDPAYVEALKRSSAWNTAKQAVLGGAGAGAPEPGELCHAVLEHPPNGTGR